MSNRSESRVLRLECLDGRDVPSVTAAVTGGVLAITSDAASDAVVVSSNPVTHQIVVVASGQAPQTFSATGVTAIQFTGGDGDDVFVNATTLPAFADGGAGNDVLVAGSAGSVLVGGDGNDVLVGGVGTDVLVGGAGDDLLFGGAGRDVIVGGGGTDALLGARDTNDLFDDVGGSGGATGNHGADVSAAAHDTTAQGRNHGADVSQVARSNGHG